MRSVIRWLSIYFINSLSARATVSSSGKPFCKKSQMDQQRFVYMLKYLALIFLNNGHRLMLSHGWVAARWSSLEEVDWVIPSTPLLRTLSHMNLFTPLNNWCAYPEFTTKYKINLIFRPLAKKASFLVNNFITTLSKIGTARFRRAIVDLMPSESVKQLRDIVDVFHKTSTEIIETKRAALRGGDEVLATQIGRGKDVISILSTTSLLSPYSAHETNVQWGRIWKLRRKINFQRPSS